MKTFPIILLGIFTSCLQNNKYKSHLKYEEYVEQNFDNYSSIYNEINVSLKLLIDKKSDNIRELLFTKDFQIDKLLLVNLKKNKAMGFVSIPGSHNKNCTHDWVFMFWSVKINNNWHFLRGGSLYVPRKNYKYNINEALNHFQLSFIGRDYFLKPFLNMNKDEITLNNNKLNDHIKITNQKAIHDSNSTMNWLAFSKKINSKTIDSLEYKKIILEKKNEVHVDAKLPKKGTKEWTKLYGTKTPLFERKEWKNLERK